MQFISPSTICSRSFTRLRDFAEYRIEQQQTVLMERITSILPAVERQRQRSPRTPWRITARTLPSHTRYTRPRNGLLDTDTHHQQVEEYRRDGLLSRVEAETIEDEYDGLLTMGEAVRLLMTARSEQ